DVLVGVCVRDGHVTTTHSLGGLALGHQAHAFAFCFGNSTFALSFGGPIAFVGDGELAIASDFSFTCGAGERLAACHHTRGRTFGSHGVHFFARSHHLATG